VEEASGLAPQPIFIAAETAWRMMTRRDPYVNMLRVTIAAFAAGLGGANAVTVLPFTSALGLPDAFARRVARNTQLVLLEESNLAKVSDPAAGSGGIEALTDELCRTAWALFQEIEKTGGTAAALESGLIQRQVAEIRTARQKAIANRRDPLTGTSEFPHLSETVVKVSQPAPPAAPPSSESALPCIRLAEPFETLRDKSDAILKQTGMRPKVFLATLGKPADNVARASFAKNVFEAGGIEAVQLAGDDLAAAFRESGALLACLCSSDEIYAAEAAAAAKALATSGARHIYLAGRPGDLADALKQAGVQSYVFAGCDVLAMLQDAHRMLGKQR
jgi:methylmalonyl-CoA mutase